MARSGEADQTGRRHLDFFLALGRSTRVRASWDPTKARGSLDRALAALAEALASAGAIGSKRAGQSGLEVSAGLLASSEEWERAATLFGAAEAQMAHTGLRGDPADEAFLAPLIANTRDAVGEPAFAAAKAAGRALPYEVALAQARASLAEYR